MARLAPAARLLGAVCVVAAAALALHRFHGAGEVARADGPIALTSRPILFDPANPAQTRFGTLEWRGGIEVSGAKPFGGLSGLLLSPHGQTLTAITDTGDWVRARLIYTDERLTGLRDLAMTPMLGSDGAALAGKLNADAEGLAGAGPRHLLASFERRHRILDYRLDATGHPGAATPLPVPGEFSTLERNQGLEAVGVLPPGQGESGAAGRVIVAIAERKLDAAGHHTGFLIAADGTLATFALTRSPGFDVTDLVFLPDGDMIVLERHYIPILGAAFRLRRIARDDIKPGALLSGTVLLTAGGSYTIDNMEGLAVHRDARGRTILTLVSDDNFSSSQRTLLMQFALPDG